MYGTKISFCGVISKSLTFVSNQIKYQPNNQRNKTERNRKGKPHTPNIIRWWGVYVLILCSVIYFHPCGVSLYNLGWLLFFIYCSLAWGLLCYWLLCIVFLAVLLVPVCTGLIVLFPCCCCTFIFKTQIPTLLQAYTRIN